MSAKITDKTKPVWKKNVTALRVSWLFSKVVKNVFVSFFGHFHTKLISVCSAEFQNSDFALGTMYLGCESFVHFFCTRDQPDENMQLSKRNMYITNDRMIYYRWRLKMAFLSSLASAKDRIYFSLFWFYSNVVTSYSIHWLNLMFSVFLLSYLNAWVCAFVFFWKIQECNKNLDSFFTSKLTE